MPPIPEERSRGYLARQVGSLVLSQVISPSPTALVRAAAWYQSMARLGVHLPLYLVHDLGHLLTAGVGPGGVSIAPRPELQTIGAIDGDTRAALASYAALLQSLAESEVVAEASAARQHDDVVGVLLARLTQDLYDRWPDPSKEVGLEELPLDPAVYAGADIARCFGEFDPAPLYGFARFVASQRLHLQTKVERVDLDSLRVLGLFHDPQALGGDLDVAELYQALNDPQARDVAGFSLELLPAVLETRRQSGVQFFGVDGYASIERRGTLDSMMLSELAWDEDLFERKLVDGELYHFGHERQREEERRLQLVLIDASASMRGVREVFARGLALTLAKKLSLLGDEVMLRFFDSRLYEPLRVGRGRALNIPQLLCFRSERGRNYGRVFKQVVAEVERIRRDRHRQVVVYILTHGECHVPREIIARLRRSALLHGVFLLPSRPLTLDYVTDLHRHQVVTRESVATPGRRKQRALEIVDAAGDAPGDAAGDQSGQGRA
jgi:hypothetical protein